MLSVKASINSYNLLVIKSLYHNDFSFYVRYYFDDNVAEDIIEKIQLTGYVDEKIVGKRPNMSTKLETLTFYGLLNQMHMEKENTLKKSFNPL